MEMTEVSQEDISPEAELEEDVDLDDLTAGLSSVED